MPSGAISRVTGLPLVKVRNTVVPYKLTQACTQCGEQYPPLQERQRFCSPKCAKRWYYVNNRETAIRNAIEYKRLTAAKRRLLFQSSNTLKHEEHITMAKPAHAPASAPAAPKIETAVEKPNQSAEAARMASPFAIEEGIPQPVKRIGVAGTSVYPFGKLEVGQSFFVPVTDKVAEPWKTMTSMASRQTKELWPKKFVTARVPATDKSPEGVRIWRTTDGTGPVPESKPRPKKAPAEAAPAPADPFVPQQAAA